MKVCCVVALTLNETIRTHEKQRLVASPTHWFAAICDQRLLNPESYLWSVAGGRVREYCTGFLVFPQRTFIALLVSGVPFHYLELT